jgi:hypothetical protein
MIDGIGAAAWRGSATSRTCMTLGRRGRPSGIIENCVLDPCSCPGRWNPKRAIPPETDPIAAAAALALEDAGWWRPGEGMAVPGALVVGVDGANLFPAERFLRDLRDGRAPSPGDFLFSLPSSPAAVLGILFGLTEYQATSVGGNDTGLRALRHALDLLELQRVERVLLAVLSAADGSLFEPPHLVEAGADGPVRCAVAWCLVPRGAKSKYPVEVGVTAGREEGREALHVELKRPGRKNGSHGEPSRASCELRGTATQPLYDASTWILYTVTQGIPPPRES